MKSKSEIRAEESIIEVENTINESNYGLDDSDYEKDLNDTTLILNDEEQGASCFKKWFDRIFYRFTRPSLRFHSSVALSLNIFAILSSKPFLVLPREFYVIFLLVSLIATYNYFYNFKTYEVY